MIVSSLLTVVLASIISTASAQSIVYDNIHNATVITGTWSSGAQNVMTGAVSYLLVRPLLFDFFCPRVSQILPICRSLTHQQQEFLTRCACFHCIFDIIRQMFYDCFSTNDGFYEISRYRFTSNGVCEISTFSGCHALMHRQDHNQLASPAW